MLAMARVCIVASNPLPRTATCSGRRGARRSSATAEVAAVRRPVMTFPSRNAAIEPVSLSNSTITYSTRGGVVEAGLPISLAPKYLLEDGIEGSTRNQADPSAAIDRGGVAFVELFALYASRSASTASAHRNTDRVTSADTKTGMPVRRYAALIARRVVSLTGVRCSQSSLDGWNWCAEEPVHVGEVRADERVVER